ncbi:reverse transcriptase domain-containing protein, partial [Tanacetum coccineum]
MGTSLPIFNLEKDNPHDHIRWFNKITSTIKYKDVPNSAIKLMLFPFSLAGAACRWLEKDALVLFVTWEDLFVSPPMATLSQNIGIIFKDMLQQPQMNTVSTSGTGSLPSNTIANPKGELKAITTRSGLVLDGPFVPMPLPFINLEEDEREEETLTDSEHEKRQEKDEAQIHKFWQMFKQLHINISLADALILILKYQKMLKSLLSNKEKLLELANTPLNENCSAVILKKLPEKLEDPRKFLIPCGFSELKCKAPADLGDSINLMPLSVWKKLGLPKLISTQMTLELANREICTPVGIARDVFVPVGKFTFLANFVIVNYESDPRVPLILGRPALIDVHGEEMILRD